MKLKPLTKIESEQLMEHRHHMCRYFTVVASYPEDGGEWRHCVEVNNKGLDDQAFLLWSKCLTPIQNLPDVITSALKKEASTIAAIRRSLEIGEMQIVNTRFVKPKPQTEKAS